MLDQIKILIIDDSEIVHKMAQKTLNMVGFKQVDYAPGGKAALEMINNTDYNLISCDITMPEMDGIETVTKILEKKPDQKIIMLTAMGQADYVIKSKELGIKHYLLKPFTPEQLIKTIK